MQACHSSKILPQKVKNTKQKYLGLSFVLKPFFLLTFREPFGTKLCLHFLKGKYHDIFTFNFFHQTAPPGTLMNE